MELTIVLKGIIDALFIGSTAGLFIFAIMHFVKKIKEEQ